MARVRLYDKIGPGVHPCHWCETPIEWIIGIGVRDPDALLVDHLDHDPTNDDPDNLVPSCNSCNSHRRVTGDTNIREDDLFIVKADGKRARAAERRCEHCGGVFLAAITEINGGKGRFCSRSCARSGPRTR